MDPPAPLPAGREEDTAAPPVDRFPGLARFPELQHGVFTRSGGVSAPPFDSLNVSFGVGDASRSVAANRRALSARFDGSRLVYCRQVHGTGVVRIGPGAGRSHALAWEVPGTGGDGDRPPQADALISDAPGTTLVIQVADCQAVLLYDPVRRAVANIHSGWRGSVADIIGRTVAAMRREFGTQPRNLRAAIGPSLGPCCAEFVHYRREIPQRYWAYRCEADRFDFWSISADQLRSAGVRSHRIETDGRCTRCRTDRFFSYRGEKTTGRFAVAIGVRPLPAGGTRRDS